MKTRWVLTSSLLGELQELWPAVFTGLFLEWIVYVVHRNELPSARGLCFGTSYQVREGSVFCVFFCIVHPSLVQRGCIMFIKGRL
jgi:hypothetical protein